MARTAAVFGATGLIGKSLTQELLQCGNWDQVIVFTRKSTGINNTRLTEILDSLEDVASIAPRIQADDLFICLGTTIAKAGTKEAFEAVDLHLPSAIAKAAAANGVRNCAVVSSLGADPSSKNFYLKTKGLMEQNMEKAGFTHLYIFRPSMLLGPRQESRPAESIGKALMQLTSFLFIGPLARYKAIQASKVALAMRITMQKLPPSEIFESDTIAHISKDAL